MTPNSASLSPRYYLGSLSLVSLGLVFILGLLIQAPAAWMDVFISKLSQGVLRVANTEGSLWRGQAELRLVPSALQSDPRTADENPQSFTVAKPVGWALGMGLRGVSLQLSGPALSGPIGENPLSLSLSGLSVPDGQLSLPAMPLEQAGTLFAMLKPQADLQLRWSGFELSQASTAQGLLVVDFNNFGTSLSPIKPLGSYRLKLSGLAFSMPKTGALTWSVEPLGEPVISISGAGQLSDMVRGILEFRCHRQCEFVNGLLSAIGKKNGEVYEAKLGT